MNDVKTRKFYFTGNKTQHIDKWLESNKNLTIIGTETKQYRNSKKVYERIIYYF